MRPATHQISPERAPKLSRMLSRELIALISESMEALSRRFPDAPLSVDDRFSAAEDAWDSLKSDLLAELDFRRAERIGGVQ